MSNKQSQETLVEAALLRSRVEAPDADALKKRILNATRSLPQKNDESNFNLHIIDTVTSKRKFKFGPQLLAYAACLVVVFVSASLLIPRQHALAPDQSFFSPDDLELQELMLIEDDLLFAQL